MKMKATLTEIRIWYEVYTFLSRRSAVSSSDSKSGCAAITSSGDIGRYREVWGRYREM